MRPRAAALALLTLSLLVVPSVVPATPAAEPDAPFAGPQATAATGAPRRGPHDEAAPAGQAANDSEGGAPGPDTPPPSTGEPYGNGPRPEPDTGFDTPHVMWQDANGMERYRFGSIQDRWYLDAVAIGQVGSVLPTVTLAENAGVTGAVVAPAALVDLVAYFGLWRDCNDDGYIGDRVTGTTSYDASATGVNGLVCPVGSRHQPAPGTVHELAWLAPAGTPPTGQHVLEGFATHVWADVGVPGAPAFDAWGSATPDPKTRPDVTFSFRAPHVGLDLLQASCVDCLGWFSDTAIVVPADAVVDRFATPTFVTTYARGGSPWVGPHAYPGARFVNGHVSAPLFDYGGEACARRDPSWSCDRSAWPGPVRVHDGYQLRDVDVLDFAWPKTAVPSAALAAQADADANGIGDAWADASGLAGGLLGRATDLETRVPALDGERAHGDGLALIAEFRWDTAPLGPLAPPSFPLATPLFPNAFDQDSDGWEDGPEHAYWNDPTNDPVLDDPAWANARLAPRDPDLDGLDFDQDGRDAMHDADSDGDALDDGAEARVWGTLPHFADSDCEPGLQPGVACHAPQRFGAPDLPRPGDGLSDADEVAAWLELGPDAWLIDVDLDGDIYPTNLVDPDSDGDGLLDGDEHACVPTCTAMHRFDSDADGLLDGPDLVFANPSDPFAQVLQAAGIACRPDETALIMDPPPVRCLGEEAAQTDPLNADSDGDGLLDGYEARYSPALNPLDPLDGDRDTDADAGDCGSWTARDEHDYLKPAAWSTGVWWNGTHPGRSDTDGDGVADGVEVCWGTEPRGDNPSGWPAPPAGYGVPSPHATLQPNHDFDDLDATVIGHLNGDDERAVAAVAAQVGAVVTDPVGALEDAADVASDLVEEALPPVLPDVWDVVAPTVADATACAERAVGATLHTALEAETTTACIAGTALNVTERAWATVHAVAAETVAPVTHAAVARLAPLAVTRTPVLAPPAPTLTTVAAAAPAVATAPPDQTNPWHPETVAPATLTPLLYDDTPFPRFTAWLTTELIGNAHVGAGDTLFSLVVDAHRDLAPAVNLIGTLDAATWTLVVADDRNATTWIRPHNALSAPVLIDADGNTATGETGADAAVTLDLVAEVAADGTVMTLPRLTVQRLGTAALPAWVAAFVQLPQSDRVVAVAVDARAAAVGHAAGLAGVTTLRLGADAESLASGAAVRYGFGATVTPDGAGRPLRVASTLFRVDETASVKTIVPGTQTDVAVLLARTPATLEAAVAVGLDEPGFTFTWAAASPTPVQAALRHEHDAVGFAGALNVADAPTSAVARFSRPADGVRATWDASATVASATAAWTTTTRERISDHGLAVTNAPTRWSLTGDTATGRFNTTASAPVTSLHYVDSVRDRATPAACHGTASEHVAYVRTDAASCAHVRVTDVQHANVDAALPGHVTFEAKRGAAGGPFTLAVDVGTRVTATLASWPHSLRATLTDDVMGLNATYEASHPVAAVDLGVTTATHATTLRARDVPAYVTGAVRAQPLRAAAHAGPTPLADLQVHRAPVGAAPPSLDDADGFIALGPLNDPDAIALRARGFRDARFDASVADGVTIRTDTTSTAPLRVHVAHGDTFVDARLPAVPRDLSATWTKTATSFTFDYDADTAVADLAASLTVADGDARFALALHDLPQRIDVTADGVSGTFNATASTPIHFFEASLTPGQTRPTFPATANLVYVDLTDPVALGETTPPTFAVRLSDFASLHGTLNATGLHVDSRFTQPTSAALRFLSAERHASVDLEALPPRVAIDADASRFTWRHTPGHVLTGSGHVDFAAFTGRFTLTGVPPFVNATYDTADDGSVNVTVTHSAPALPRLAVAASGITLGALSTPVAFAFDATDLPPHVTVAGAASGVAVSAFDDAGSRTTLPSLTAAFAGDHARGLPALAPTTHAAFGRVTVGNLSATDVAVRVQDLARLEASGPRAGDPGTIVWRGRAGGLDADVAVTHGDGATTSLRFAAARVPSALDATVTFDGSDVNATLAANDALRDVRVQASTADATLTFTGDVPSDVSFERRGALVRYYANAPTSWQATLAPADGQAPAAPGASDHIVIDLKDATTPRLNVSLTGVTALRFDARASTATQADVRAELRRAAPNHLVVQYADADTAAYANVRGAPAVIAFNLTDAVAWHASSRATSAFIALDTEDTVLRARADGVPQDWRLTAPARAPVTLTSGLGDPFDAVRVRIARDGTGVTPTLDATDVPWHEQRRGFIVDRSVDDAGTRERYYVRLDGVVNATVATDPQLDVTVTRSTSGGAFAGVYRGPDARADVALAHLPMHSHVLVDAESATRAVVTVTADASTGFADLRYQRDEAEDVAVAFTNLPASFAFAFAKDPGDRIDVTYRPHGPRADPSAPTNGTVDARFAGGDTVIATLAAVAGGLDVTIDPVAQAYRVNVTNAPVTGDFRFTAPGARLRELPAGTVGLNAAIDSPATWLHARFDGLLAAGYNVTDGQHRVRVLHAAPREAPFRASVTTANGNVTATAAATPRELTAFAYATGNRTHVTVNASEPLARLTFTGAALGADRADVSAVVTPAPQRTTATWTRTDTDVNLTVRHDARADRTPFLALDLDVPGTVTVNATVRDLPNYATLAATSRDLETDPGDGCRFRWFTSAPVGLVAAEVHVGPHTTSTWLHESQYWLGLDASAPGEKHYSVRVPGITEASLCHPGGERSFKLVNTAPMNDLRILQQNATSTLKVTANGIAPGDLTWRTGGDGWKLEQTLGLDSVHAEWRHRVFLEGLGRDLETLAASIQGVPALLEQTTTQAGGRATTRLDGHGGPVTRAHITVRVGQNPAPQDPIAGGEDRSANTVEVGVAVDDLLIRVADSPNVVKHATADRQLVLRGGDRWSVRLEGAGLRSVVADIQDFARFKSTTLAVTAHQPASQFVISGSARDLVAIYDTPAVVRLSSTSFVESQGTAGCGGTAHLEVQGSEAIRLVETYKEVQMPFDSSPWTARVRLEAITAETEATIEGGSVCSLSNLVARAIRSHAEYWRENPSIGRVAVAIHRGTEWLDFEAERVEALSIRADHDGAQTGAAGPRFIALESDYAGRLHYQAHTADFTTDFRATELTSHGWGTVTLQNAAATGPGRFARHGSWAAAEFVQTWSSNGFKWTSPDCIAQGECP